MSLKSTDSINPGETVKKGPDSKWESILADAIDKRIAIQAEKAEEYAQSYEQSEDNSDWD